MKSILQAIIGPPGLILMGAIISAVGALWASQQAAQFEHALRSKSDEIAELNKEIVKSVIGGDSFCYLAIGSIDPQSNVGILTLVHQGAHPLYDLQARIVDLQKFDKIKHNININNFRNADTIIPIGNMIKGTASMLGSFPLGSEIRRDFNVFFGARNGLFTQIIRMRKVDGKWVEATKVERDNKIIFERVEQGYPRNEKGNVDW